MGGWSDRALRALQDELIEQLEERGASAVVVHYVLTDLLAHRLTYAEIAQRVRRARERSARHAWQASQKPELLRRCVSAYEARCAYCDRSGNADVGPDGRKWELDRIFPGRLGGEYEPLNVALACHACNQRKGGNFGGIPVPALADMEAA